MLFGGAPGGTRTPINAFDGLQIRNLLLYRLSYQREWCAQYDSNVRPKPYKGLCSTTELHAQFPATFPGGQLCFTCIAVTADFNPAARGDGDRASPVLQSLTLRQNSFQVTLLNHQVCRLAVICWSQSHLQPALATTTHRLDG